MLDLGERLRIARDRAHVGVQEMATALGRGRNMVTLYERGDNAPLWVVRRYVEVLGNCTLEWLVAEVGPSPSRPPKLKLDAVVTAGSVGITQRSMLDDKREPPPLVGAIAVHWN